MSSNLTIKIPSQLYVGISSNETKNNVPLGFMTPYEPNLAAFEKRKSTITEWVNSRSRYYRRYCKLVPKEPIIVDNIPQEGFRIAKDIRRVYWGGGNVVWRIEDPRGFELEISSSNLARIIDCSIIENGIIRDACVWGRDGAKNILLPISSEPYKQAFENTKRIAKKVNLKDVNIGDTVLLKNGMIGVYAGAVNMARSDHTTTFYRNHSFKMCNIVRRYVLRRECSKDELSLYEYGNIPVKEGDPKFDFFSDMLISEIVERSEQPKDFMSEITQFIDTVRNSGLYSILSGVFYVSNKPIKKESIEMVFEPVTIENVGLFSLKGDHIPSFPRTIPFFFKHKNSLVKFGSYYNQTKKIISSNYKNGTFDMEAFTFSYVDSSPTSIYGSKFDSESYTFMEQVLEGNITKVGFNINGKVYFPTMFNF